jgi:hypothetical protein
MPLTYSTQTQIAFKNLSGKSQTDRKGVLNEYYGYSFNIPASNVWSDTLLENPQSSISQGYTVEVVADLTLIEGSNKRSYLTNWPLSPPDGVDTKTGLTFSYGSGSLVGVTAGDRITNIIPPNFGFSYSVIPYTNYPSVIIPPLDTRDWVYQYNSGIFYQDVVIGLTPSKIKVYPYIVNTLNISSGFENIRISATGTNDYYAITSSPIISQYSSNYLFLVDFANTNTSGTVSLNVLSLGTYSIKKSSSSGFSNLNVGEIIGGTSGNIGSIYYLTFNGSEFQFYNSTPEQSSLSFTKPNSSPNSVGSLPVGSSFDNVSIQNVFNDILYGDELGNISSFNLLGDSGYLDTIEVGDIISPSTYTFSWGLQNSTLFENDSVTIEREGTGNLVTGYVNNSPYSWTLGATLSYSSTYSEIFNLFLKRTKWNYY